MVVLWCQSPTAPGGAFRAGFFLTRRMSVGGGSGSHASAHVDHTHEQRLPTRHVRIGESAGVDETPVPPPTPRPRPPSSARLHVATVKTLLQLGAQMGARTAAGETALDLSVRLGHYEVAQVLRHFVRPARPSASTHGGGGGGREQQTEMALQQMIGMTVETPSGLAAHPSEPSVAYVAGCAVVLARVSGSSGHETYLRRATAADKHPKAFTCVAFCPSGDHVAAGEVPSPISHLASPLLVA